MLSMLVITFTIMFKMPKMVHFLVTVWARYLSTHGRSYGVLAENCMDNRLWT